jgi:hypothetical protein
MRSMQCNVEVGYQLYICSGTKENHEKPWSSWLVIPPRSEFPFRCLGLRGGGEVPNHVGVWGAWRKALISPDDRGISRIRRPRWLKVSTLWLQYPSATNTCPEVATATAVGWQRSVWPPPGRNRSPKVRAGRVSPGRNCNTHGTPQGNVGQLPPASTAPTDILFFELL